MFPVTMKKTYSSTRSDILYIVFVGSIVSVKEKVIPQSIGVLHIDGVTESSTGRAAMREISKSAILKTVAWCWPAPRQRASPSSSRLDLKSVAVPVEARCGQSVAVPVGYAGRPVSGGGQTGGAADRRGNRRRPGARTFRRTNLNRQREVYFT
jgi:hypothetical protein